MLLLVLAAIFAPLITSYDPLVGNPPPTACSGVFSGGHVLGTDEQGRDMFARIVYGGRLSLVAGFVPTLVAALIGTAIGVTAGMISGLIGSA